MLINETTKEYLSSLRSLGKDDTLLEFRNLAIEERIPIITEDVESLIKIILKSVGAKTLFEVGSGVGYSSCVFASAMGKDSKIVTVEREEVRVKEAKDNIKKCGFENNIKVILDDAREVLKREDGKYDVVFLDGNKGHYIHMLDDCKRILKQNGLLLCDNVLFRGMIDKSSPLIRRKITIVKRLRKFLDEISGDEDFITEVLPIGDGFSISLKK